MGTSSGPQPVRFEVSIPGPAYDRHGGIECGDLVDVQTRDEPLQLFKAILAQPHYGQVLGAAYVPYTN